MMINKNKEPLRFVSHDFTFIEYLRRAEDCIIITIGKEERERNISLLLYDNAL